MAQSEKISQDEINIIISKHEAENPPVIFDFNTGHPRVPFHEPTLDKTIKDLKKISLAQYAPTDGIDESFRQPIADYFNLIYKTLGPEQLSGKRLAHYFTEDNCLLDTGSTKLFVNLFKAAIEENPEKKVFVSLGPMYSAQLSKIKELGGEVFCIIGDKDNEFQPTKDQVLEQLKERGIKIEDIALVMRGTQNPYAKVLPSETIQEHAKIIDMLCKKGAINYEDQPYFGISAKEEDTVLKYLSDKTLSNTVVSNSLSKIAGMPGEGGFLATTNEPLRQKLKKMIDLCTSPTTNHYVKNFLNYIVQQDRDIKYSLQSEGVGDLNDAARQLIDIGFKVAKVYAYRQNLMDNLLVKTMDSFGLDSNAMIGKEDSAMYKKLFAGKNDKELSDPERKDIPDFKTMELSKEKILYGGKLSFQDVLGKSTIETGEDLKNVLFHIKGLESCGGFSCRELEIFGVPSNEAGVRLCHTNIDDINIKAVESIYKFVEVAYGLKPIKEYSEIVKESREEAKQKTNEDFKYAANPQLAKMAERNRAALTLGPSLNG